MNAQRLQRRAAGRRRPHSRGETRARAFPAFLPAEAEELEEPAVIDMAKVL